MGAREQRERARQLPSGTVTFLFTDIEGSTRLLQRVGPRYRDVLEAHADLIRSAVDARDGVEVSSEGDGFFIAFDRAANAVAATLDAQRAVSDHAWPEGTTLRVRMGLHTGEGVTGNGDYVGLDVHRASRIAAVAHGGQVLLSGSTASLVEGALPPTADLRDLGDHRLRDLDRPEHLFQLVAQGLPAAFPPLRTGETRPHNLPTQATAFIGRERQLREVEELLRTARLVTLIGPGGAGKTRLAIQAASTMLESFRDGAFLVRLESLEDPALVTTAIARVLGVMQDGDRTLADLLGDRLAGRELLLVLDNLEHLLAGARQVGELLQAAPGLKVLATSRAPLRLRGEQELPVPPLEMPGPRERPDPDRLRSYEAIDLFVRRAREADPRFELTAANAAAVAGIARRLDGLPLALELAAARVRVLPPGELLDRLSDRLGLLTSGPADAPDRQRTLRESIVWSHELLAMPERILCRRLGVFAGSFTLEAAEVLGGGPPVSDVLGGISALVDASLLQRRVDVEHEVRFQMLETIRAFAREQLAESGEADELADAHTAHFLARAEAADRELALGSRGAWLGRLELDHDDLRLVLARSLERGDADIGLRLAKALRVFWQLRGHLDEGREWLDRLLELPDASISAKAGGLLGLAFLAYGQADLEDARRLYGEALSLQREIGDIEGTVEALFFQGIGALYRRDAEAGPLLEEACRLAEDAQDPYLRFLPRVGLGLKRFLSGDLDGAEAIFTDAVAEADALGIDWPRARTLGARGAVELARQRYDEAGATAREALELALEVGDLIGVGLELDLIAAIIVSRGEPRLGVRLAGAVKALRAEVGTGLDRILWEDPVELARPRLTEAELEAAWKEGLATDLDGALAMARRATSPGVTRTEPAGPAS